RSWPKASAGSPPTRPSWKPCCTGGWRRRGAPPHPRGARAPESATDHAVARRSLPYSASMPPWPHGPPRRSMPDPVKTKRPHLLIVGGGFAGLWAARALADAPLRITLLDRDNHHLFQPLLYQVATAGLSAPDIAAPLRHI